MRKPSDSCNASAKPDGETSDITSNGSTGNRGKWAGKFQYILTVIGLDVGLGNVWRFPYVVYRNGGGAFFIPYIIMLLLIGIPLLNLEMNLAQFASLGPISVWKVSPMMKGLGYSMLFTNIGIALYYNVIICWCIYYLFASFTARLPWENCSNAWNTRLCCTIGEFTNLTANNVTEINIDNVTVTRGDLTTTTEEFYYRKVLQISPGLEYTGTIIWQLALCLFLSYVVILLVLYKGVQSLGKISIFTTSFPYVILTVMLIRSVTLPGSELGIQFYIIPDWSKLGDIRVWVDAASQVFYALSIGLGGIIALSSYSDFNNNTLRDTFIVPTVNLLTSVYAGFVVFSLIGYMAKSMGVPVDEVAEDGPGLVFVVYPEGLSTMPGAPVWSALFYLMMILLGWSSMFTMVETFFVSIIDEFPNFLRKSLLRSFVFRLIGVVAFYLISLVMVTNCGFYIFTLLDFYLGSFPLLVIGLLENVTVIYIYGYKNFSEDIRLMLGKNPSLAFKLTWHFVSPLIMLLSIVSTSIAFNTPTLFDDSYTYPPLGPAVGWTVVAFCLSFVPAFLLYVVCKRGAWRILIDSSRPEKDWGPAEILNRKGRYSYLNKNVEITEI